MSTLEPARLWGGLSLPNDFSVSWLDQPGVPISGTSDLLRKLSPFVIRIQIPSILGDFSDVQRPEATDRTTIEARRDSDLYRPARDFGGAASSLSSPGSGQDEALSRLLRSGGGIPGLSTARVQDFERVITQARLQRARGGDPVPAIADRVAAADIIIQVRKLLSVPPVVLLINPQSMSIQYQKVAQFQERTRKGYTYSAWGDDSPKLKISCLTGAFIAGSQSRSQASRSPSGVQWAAKRHSAAFQQLMSILQVYKSSGYIYDTVGKSRAIHMVGSIVLEYDQKVYEGHMDSFEYSYDAEKPAGGIPFSFDFTCEKEIDLAPRTRTLGPLSNPNGSAFSRALPRSRPGMIPRDPPPEVPAPTAFSLVRQPAPTPPVSPTNPRPFGVR